MKIGHNILLSKLSDLILLHAPLVISLSLKKNPQNLPPHQQTSIQINSQLSTLRQIYQHQLQNSSQYNSVLFS